MIKVLAPVHLSRRFATHYPQHYIVKVPQSFEYAKEIEPEPSRDPASTKASNATVTKSHEDVSKLRKLKSKPFIVNMPPGSYYSGGLTKLFKRPLKFKDSTDFSHVPVPVQQHTVDLPLYRGVDNFFEVGGLRVTRHASRGVWGHAPQGNFGFFVL